MNKFEVVLIYSPELSSNAINRDINSFKSKINEFSGQIINEEDWGLRDLSYSINKFKKAFYKFFQVEVSGKIIKDINKDLNQSENLIRYLFIKVNEHQELPTKMSNEKK